MSEYDSDPVCISRVPDWFEHPSSHSSSTHVSAPVEITCYSRSSDRKVHLGSRDALRTLKRPQLPADLNMGYGNFIPKNEEGGTPIDPVVLALQSAHFDIEGEADVVTFRNNLNKIALTPYEIRNDWEIHAVQIGSTVFLDVKKTEEGSYPSQQLYMYYGYAFEALCHGDNKPVDANVEFCSIIRLRIGRHRILLSAEIDGVMKSNLHDVRASPNILQQYVELKTIKEPRVPRDFENLHRFKFLKYWVQSYLAGVPRILLGVRDSRGVLLRVDELSTRRLPNMTADALRFPGQDDRTYDSRFRSIHQRHQDQKAGIWNPFVCINHLDFVLENIRQRCAAAKGTAFRFKYDASRRSIFAYPADEKAVEFAARVSKLMKS